MATDTTIKEIDAIYETAMAKLETIAAKHKAEIDAYIKELKDAKVKQLEKELKS